MSALSRGAAAALATFAIATLGGTPNAAASFPGANGRLAVELDTCEFNPFVGLFTPGGTSLGALTPRCEVVGQDEFEDDIVRATELYDWSPDGSRLLLQQSGVAPEGIITIAGDGTDPRLVSAPAGATDASFGPGARQIVFMSGGSIWTMPTDGGEARRVRAVPTCRHPTRDCVAFARPRWSPDGKLIAFEVEQTEFGSGRPPKLRPGIWLMRARTGKLVRRVAKAGFEVDWSPDARRLVYRTADQQQEIEGGASGGDLWVVRATGGGAHRLVHRERLAEVAPAWSPDGRWIAWVSLRFGPGDVGFDVKPSLWRVRSGGGKPRRIAGLREPYVEEGDFSPPALAWQPLPAR